MFLYVGKLNWNQDTHQKAEDECITLVFPVGFALNDPVSAYWQWTVDAFGVEKRNTFQLGKITSGTKTINQYVHVPFEYFSFDAIVSADMKNLSLTMSNPAGAQQMVSLSLQYRDAVPSPETLIFIGKLNWYHYSVNEMVTLVIPGNVANGESVVLCRQWTVDAKGKVKPNTITISQMSNVRPGSTDGSISATVSSGYYTYDFTLVDGRTKLRLAMANPSGDRRGPFELEKGRHVRKDVERLTDAERDQLITAFRGIQAKDPDDPLSFFHIASLHGQPFRGAGYSNSAYWGGYCHHGNVLFPTWHRAYLHYFEKALRSIEGCETVAMPYWNELGKPCLPDIIKQITYTYKSGKNRGKTIDNPLYSYKFQQGFLDRLARLAGTKVIDYRKYKGYETVRYPYSGLIGPHDKEATDKHNAVISAMGQDEVNKELDDQVKNFLDHFVDKNNNAHPGAAEAYNLCLFAPNYTVFSNTTSASKYNDDHTANLGMPVTDEQSPTKNLAVSLELPHNYMHLAIGGYDLPDNPDPAQKGANGDMGENDTAAFDPVFYFHHCFIDRVFWSWQTHHDQTSALAVKPLYPGTSPIDNQGPTPGTSDGTWLDMNTPLTPFKADNDTDLLTSNDLADITKVGYDYDSVIDLPKRDPRPARVVRVSGINRGLIGGSFVVSIMGKSNVGAGEPQLMGYEPVFSRWHVAGCANCRNSLSVPMHIPWVQYAPSLSEPRNALPGGSQPLIMKPINFPDAKRFQYTVSVVSSSASEEEREHVVSDAICEVGSINVLTAFA
ncbi:tyrosinase [Grosmannia clavigera kw1407]|uniref:tyrosinase n=1 Tax=Grosmannia clavigera (strain kw1407 / UAMH 11150) TaxID=655863 RepID=F0X9X8_GROCL|nr:tyrosinase [Grosmannia clavigera kw1407]EFX05793.1 tyrosinase [Grosmannia clavigera kw1407]